MFLVDDDEAEARHRREDREARAKNEIRLAGRGRAPRAAPCPRGQPAVQRDHAPPGQRPRDARFELRREIDLRDEEQHLPARANARGRRGEVDLRLAAARDAVEQERRIACLRGVDGLGRASLIAVERDDGRTGDGALGRLRGRASSALARRTERRHHLRECETERFLVITGDETRELEEIARQRRNVGNDLAQGLHALGADVRRRGDVDDNSDQRAPRESNANDRTARHGKARWHPIVERQRCGDRKGDARNRHPVTPRERSLPPIL